MKNVFVLTMLDIFHAREQNLLSLLSCLCLLRSHVVLNGEVFVLDFANWASNRTILSAKLDFEPRAGASPLSVFYKRATFGNSSRTKEILKSPTSRNTVGRGATYGCFFVGAIKIMTVRQHCHLVEN